MSRSFLLFLIVWLVGCAEEKTADSFLSQPPYQPLTDSIKLAPANADLHYRRGVMLYQNDQSAYALTDIRQAWTLASKEEYGISLARLLLEKNPDSAILFLQEARKKLPASIALSISLARGYQQKGQLAKANEIVNTILQQYPNQVDALLLKTELLDAEGKTAEALAALEKAQQLAPGDVEIVHQLAFRYAETKNKKVLPLADALIASDLNRIHAEPHLFKGIYYYQLKNYPEAIRHFNDAIAKDYKYLDGHMYKGQVLYDQQKYDEALKAFQLALTITPTYAEAYYWIGRCEEAKGNKTEARLAYERAYGLDKEFTEAREAAARMK